MSPPKNGLPQGSEVRPKKPKFATTAEQVIEYAKVAIENERMVEISRLLWNGEYRSDEAHEDLTGEMARFARAYIDEKGLPWQLSGTFGRAHFLVSRKLRGVIDELDDEAAKNFLRGDPQII